MTKVGVAVGRLSIEGGWRGVFLRTVRFAHFLEKKTRGKE